VRLLLTGGGTAGHVYPLLSILEELKKKLKDERLEVLYLGSKGGIEEEILKEQKITKIFIYTGKWRRYWFKSLSAFLSNLLDLFLILIGFFQAFFIVVRFRPDIVMAKGGYVTIPAIFASLVCRIPVITHESDVVMGLSNRIAAAFAKKICVSFPVEFYKGLPSQKLIFTGNPVRKEFYEIEKEIKRVRRKIPTILITGGSQGSQKINQLIFSILPKLLKFAKVVHLTGPLGFEEAKKNKEKLRKDLKDRYLIYDFIDKEMPKIMKESDIVISRAGAGALAEIAATHKPSILIPLPTAAGDHQTKNAIIFEQKKAAIVIKENELSSDKILKEIRKLIKNKNTLIEMGQRAGELSQTKAASKIVEEIIRLRND
jgi:UDP-N-acetylglucosamine--N-acetylmuramyl-(pentapeptide) pyrophosphoryl-undecaprenol N-acetylglucosamine transferase